MNYLQGIYKNYFNFKGRATRKDFWSYSIVSVTLLVIFLYCHTLYSFSKLIYLLYALYTVLFLVPWTAVCVRRLHDIDKSATWLAVGLIPFAGWFWLLVLFTKKGNTEQNQYGPNPRKETIANK